MIYNPVKIFPIIFHYCQNSSILLCHLEEVKNFKVDPEIQFFGFISLLIQISQVIIYIIIPRFCCLSEYIHFL